MVYNKNQPYNDLPDLPPLREIVESKDVLRKSITANKALACLKGSAQRLPNPVVLTRSIILLESKISSEIENVITTNDELFQANSSEDQPITPQTKEVLHYNKAIWYGFEELKKRPLTTSLFVEILQIFKEHIDGIRKMPGTKIANNIGETIYTPPEGEDLIKKKLINLENFINLNDEDLDPLIKLGIIHYQFEAIHPFSDGNGRTGRIVNILYLLMNHLLELPVIYLSKYIVENKTEYYLLLKNVTEKGDWETWILFMLDAIEKTAIFTQQKIEAICELMKETEELIQEKLPDVKAKKSLVEVLFREPYCKIKFLEEEGIAKRVTASTYLKNLETIGVLKVFPIGKEKLYVNLKFYELLKDNTPLEMDALVRAKIQSIVM